MTERKIYGIDLVKCVLLYTLVIAFLGAFGSKNIPQHLHTETFTYSVDANQSGSQKLHDLGLSNYSKDLEGSEIVEEENDDDHHSSSIRSFLSVSLPLFFHKKTIDARFPPIRGVKLFILFHSWKSFLHI